jgi:hypothetical protein
MVRPVNSYRFGSAELLCNSAAVLSRRDSLAVRQGYPASQEKPQSYKPTLRYNDNTSLRGPAGSGENTDPRGPELTGCTN